MPSNILETIQAAHKIILILVIQQVFVCNCMQTDRTEDFSNYMKLF